MAELPELLKRRAILKSSLTRFTTFFENHKSNIAHAKQISIRKEVLNKTFNDFNDIQTSIELLKDDEEAYRESFETDYYKVIADVSSYLESHTLTSSSTSVNSSQGIAESVIAKLPPINLPSFEGNYIEWVNFKNTFDSMIHERNDLTNIQKFHYLKSSVKGEAQKLIVHLAITHDNYITAYNLLKSRFENKRIIVQQHVNTIINLPQVTKGSPASLRQLLDGLSTNLSILQNLDIPVQSWDIILIQLMLSKLDYQSRREWETSCKTTNIPTLKEFSDTLTNHCLTLEALSDSQKGKSSTIEKPKQSQKSFVSVKNETTTKKCLYCNKSNHYLYQCKEFLSLAVSNRIDQINKRKLCKNCLRTNHDSDSCKGGYCRVCGSNTHNTLLHKDTSEQLDEINNDVNVLNSSTTLPINVILSTALVQVQDKAGNFTQLRALLDSGSQSNFITESALKMLNLPSYDTNITLSGVNNSHSKVNKSTTLIFKSNFNKFQVSVKCLVLPKITQNIPASPLVYDTFKIPSNIKLADPTFNKPGPIDLLLGNELFWKVLCVGKVQLGPAKRLIAQNTQLGWILGGCWDTNKENTKTICTFSSKNLEKQMVKFWQIEEIDHKPILSREHERCEKQFLECHKRLTNGKFQVPLMFKSESPNIGLSFDQAQKRIQSDHNIEWHFIPPRSPHMGGLWEANIKCVKNHLKRVIGNANLTFEELYTVLTSIEAILNSRPLCPLSNDPNDLSYLTPGHFLVGEPLNAPAEFDLTDVNIHRLSRWQHVERIRQHFWKRWSNEYLTTLQQRTRWITSKDKVPHVGSLVLIKETNAPPLQWKLGRITQLHPGPDKVVRVVSVKCNSSEFKRSINYLCPLPTD
jgi:hypothetical protein